MCLRDLSQISAQLKNTGIFDIHFGIPGGCLAHGAAIPHSAADPVNTRFRYKKCRKTQGILRICFITKYGVEQ